MTSHIDAVGHELAYYNFFMFDISGQYAALQADRILFHERSEFQDILIFENVSYGRVMVLNGLINSTEKDEFAYHEMITFLPLNVHPCPKKVLIIGEPGTCNTFSKQIHFSLNQSSVS